MTGKTDLLYLLSQKLEGNWPSWKGENLTREVLENVLIEKNWFSLDVNLKLKLLFALTTLKKSVVKELSDVISKILVLASQDNNKESEWVLVIARIFSNFMQGTNSFYLYFIKIFFCIYELDQYYLEFLISLFNA
jgi:hypothetical protein